MCVSVCVWLYTNTMMNTITLGYSQLNNTDTQTFIQTHANVDTHSHTVIIESLNKFNHTIIIYWECIIRMYIVYQCISIEIFSLYIYIHTLTYIINTDILQLWHRTLAITCSIQFSQDTRARAQTHINRFKYSA